MKHWDLIPGEHVCLVRSLDYVDGVDAVFRFHTTLLACFERAPGDLIEFTLHEDGGLLDEKHRRWFVKGPDRNTRHVIQQPLGQGRHFTRTTFAPPRRPTPASFRR